MLSNMNRSQTILRASLAALVLGSALFLSACITEPGPRPAALPPSAAPPPSPPPPSEVFAYPQRGQTPQQQDRDRYECSTWATQQTGFDPSAPGVPPHERVAVVPGPPPTGAGTAIGAVTGAILGAAIARPWQAAPAALAGAVVGGAIGNAAEQSNAQPRTVVVQDRRAQAAQLQQAADYKRAIAACLDARGYTVR
jgi:Glycine zipper 2TM domain